MDERSKPGSSTANSPLESCAFALAIPFGLFGFYIFWMFHDFSDGALRAIGQDFFGFVMMLGMTAGLGACLGLPFDLMRTRSRNKRTNED
jgi:hypothetical protein